MENQQEGWGNLLKLTIFWSLNGDDSIQAKG